LLWPYIHWTIAIGFTVLAVETIYFLAPKVKQRFLCYPARRGPFSPFCWSGLSFLLRIYFRYFGNYNRTYGTLAGVMALMTWLYWHISSCLAGGTERGVGQSAKFIPPIYREDRGRQCAGTPARSA